MLEVYLNDAAPGCRCLVFPPQKRGQQTAVGTDEQMAVIREARSSLARLDAHMEGKVLRPGQGIRELEFLDRHTEGMTEREKTIFQAALDIEMPYSLTEIVNLSCNLDKFCIYEGATDYETQGRQLLEETKVQNETASCPDDTTAGKEYAQSHKGSFTQAGYVVRMGEALAQVYDGKHIPTPGYDRSCVIQAFLYSPYYAAERYRFYPVSLPASGERLVLAEKNLGVKGLDECLVTGICCPIPELECFLPFSREPGELNTFAKVAAEKGILKDAFLREKLYAALEAEAPEDMTQAAGIAGSLERYRMLPEGTGSAADGAVQTEYGTILRTDSLIRQIPKELTEFKLFSPLKGFLYPYGEEEGGISDYAEELNPGELCWYEDEILEQIDQEHLEEEGERGLAAYLNNRLLRRKVFSMEPTVECWNGELWGVLKVKSHGSLSPGELSGLMDEWQGQESDGWGEGFEQRQIRTEEGEVCVSFWNSGSDFFIRTEQELKQAQSPDFGMQM